MKTHLLLKVMLMAGLLLAGACTPTGQEEGEYTLSSDKTSVNINEEVTFTVKSEEGRDVTSEWNFSDDTGIREGNRFGWSEPGTYTVTAVAKTNPALKAANTVTVTVSETEVTYTISCDKTEVKVNEEVTFTVTSSAGEDVTEAWNLCDESMCRVGNKFGWSEPGTHTVTAHSKANPEIEAENTITIEVSGSVYKLYADQDVVYVLDEVTFHVKEIIDGVEQEEDAYGFEAGIKGGERFSQFGAMANVFPEAGVYTVDAVKYDFKGAEIARAENTVEIIVKERDITGYEDRYYRRSLMAEGTGTNCTGCPAMAETIEYTETYLLPDRMIPLAFHLNDDACNVPLYRNFFILTNDYGIFAYPYYIIDWNLTYKSTSSDAEALKHSIEASQARYAQTPGLAVETTLSGRELTVKIKTTPRETAEYFLGAYIVEDDIYTEQSGADDGMMMQRNVAYYCLTEPEGNQDDLPEEGIGKYGRLGLEPLGTLEGEREYTYDYRFPIPTHEPIDHNLDNCRLVYFICKADATIEPYGYFCANAATCRLGQSQEYEFEPIYGE